MGRWKARGTERGCVVAVGRERQTGISLVVVVRVFMSVSE